MDLPHFEQLTTINHKPSPNSLMLPTFGTLASIVGCNASNHQTQGQIVRRSRNVRKRVDHHPEKHKTVHDSPIQAQRILVNK